MPELPERTPSSQIASNQPAETARQYRITRKGSRYNIIGPEGRIFTKNKSASVAGPRWEELTHTPWPHESSAYESGLRLWELGLISREQIGSTTPPASSVPPATAPIKSRAEQTKEAAKKPLPKKKQPRKQAKRTARKSSASRPVPPTEQRATPPAHPQKPAQTSKSVQAQPAQDPVAITLVQLPLPLALPAPKIDLDQQAQLIAALRKNPKLLFRDDIRCALQHEIEYNRPYARWAQSLLKLLVRYEASQRKQVPASLRKQETILARHIAWQEQRLKESAVAAN